MRPTPRAKTRKREERLRHVIAQNVKAQRKVLGLTNAEAAQDCGLHARHLQKVESGELNITLATLAGLSAGLEIEAADLLTERQRPKEGVEMLGARRGKLKGRKR